MARWDEFQLTYSTLNIRVHMGSAHLCVYDANHNGDDMSVTISCPLASGCCEKGCCKLPVTFIANSHVNSSLSEEPISASSQINETILLITLTLMIFFFGCVSLLFIFRKIQDLRRKEHEPDFVYHAYRPPQPKIMVPHNIYGSPC